MPQPGIKLTAELHQTELHDRNTVENLPVEDSEDADEEGDGGHDDLPRLAGAKLAVGLEQLSQWRQHHLLVATHGLKKSYKDFLYYTIIETIWDARLS